MTDGKNISEVREALLSKEAELKKLRAELLELKRNSEPVEMPEYVFTAHDGAACGWTDLFQGRQDLILVHNMGVVCPYCTMWADGLNGLLPHLEDRAAFVVTTPDSVDVQRKFKERRGWGFRMYSIDEEFLKAMGFYQADEKMGPSLPGVSTFHRDASGRVLRIGQSFFGPGDDFCAVWHLFDLLARGVDGWQAKFSYAESSADFCCGGR